MSEEKKSKQGFSADWLIGGLLGKFGEILDRITGRGWNPSSSLAASRLTEKLKFLLDEESKIHNGGRFVPHEITLKIQWNKFSSDSEDEIVKLEHELHAAAIDHINDKLYHTFAPIKIDVKTDYFTEGVRMVGTFGEFGEEEEEAAINVTLPNITIDQLPEGTRASINLEGGIPAGLSNVFVLTFQSKGKQRTKELREELQKRYTVGRAKDNDVTIDDQSVSKVHASLVIKDDGRLVVADTGSTNGTYVDGERIAYGKAVDVLPGKELKFGTIVVEVEKIDIAPKTEVLPEPIQVEPLATSAETVAAQEVIPEQQLPIVEQVEISPAETNETNSEAWAMTDDVGKIEPPVTQAGNIPVSDELPKPMSSAPKAAPQPPAETVASIETEEDDGEDWGKFEGSSGESELNPEKSKSEEWDSFKSDLKSSVENSGTGDDWSDFSEPESAKQVAPEPEKEKEDWEI